MLVNVNKKANYSNKVNKQKVVLDIFFCWWVHKHEFHSFYLFSTKKSEIEFASNL